MADINISINQDPTHRDLNHVALNGAINATTVIDFQQTMDTLMEQGIRHFVLDFRDVSYINSTGMGILVQYTDTCRHDKGNLVLLNVHQKVKVAFDILGLDEYFQMIKDKAEAVTLAMTPQASKKESAAATDAGTDAADDAAPTTPAGPAVRERKIKTDGKFPKVVQCAFCHLPIRVEGAGEFSCPACFTHIKTDTDGTLTLRCRTDAIPVKLTLPYSDLGYKSALSFIDIFAREHGFDDVALDKVKSSVDEILRAIRGGDPDGNEALFTVLCTSDHEALRFRFTDNGTAFPIQDKSFLSKTRYLMDRIQYKANPRTGNILQVTKLLRKK